MRVDGRTLEPLACPSPVCDARGSRPVIMPDDLAKMTIPAWGRSGHAGLVQPAPGLHGTLIRDERRSAESREAQVLVFSYLHSRSALPGLQFHLDALKRLPGTAKLIAEANAFLAIVTASREGNKGDKEECPFSAFRTSLARALDRIPRHGKSISASSTNPCSGWLTRARP